VSKQSIPGFDYESIGKFRLIRSVMGETVSFSLVRVTLQCSLCSGRFLCGLATSLPSGIDVLLGNNLCPSLPAVDMAVVSRSQSAVMHIEAELQPSLDPDPDIFPAEVESDLAGRSASLFEGSVAAETIPFELVNSTELIRIQQSDLGLSSLFELAEKGDDRYFFESGVLFRAWRDTLVPPERSIHQLVVPASVRP